MLVLLEQVHSRTYHNKPSRTIGTGFERGDWNFGPLDADLSLFPSSDSKMWEIENVSAHSQ